MKTHTLDVTFSETPFDECYFTLDGYKTKRLNRYPDNTYRRTWEKINLVDSNGDESVRFALSARGVAGGHCKLELHLDGKELETYENLKFANNGWVSKVDIIYPKKPK